MEFTYDFIRIFSIGLFYAGPLLATLALIIIILGHFLVRIEGWSKADALYHAFVTATTLGYGDFHPSKKRSKVLAIMITFVGIIFTGIMVAIALHAASHAFKETHDFKKI
ncbi:potassium channel family protein [Pseudomonadota bacterium]